MLVLRTLVDSVHQGFFFVARRLLNVHRVGRCARMDMSQTSVADLLGSANSVSQILTWSAYRCILTFHQIHIDSHPFHHPPSPFSPVLPCSPLFSPVLTKPLLPLSNGPLLLLPSDLAGQFVNHPNGLKDLLPLVLTFVAYRSNNLRVTSREPSPHAWGEEVKEVVTLFNA